MEDGLSEAQQRVLIEWTKDLTAEDLTSAEDVVLFSKKWFDNKYAQNHCTFVQLPVLPDLPPLPPSLRDVLQPTLPTPPRTPSPESLKVYNPDFLNPELDDELVDEAKIPNRHPGQLTTIRIYISSSSHDMLGEREVLIKTIIPALNARFCNRWLHFVAVDMRYGITEQPTADYQKLYLEELDRCRVEPGEAPWVLFLRGMRAGPLQHVLEQFPTSTCYGFPENYTWVDEPESKSLQCMLSLEACHGALHVHRPTPTPAHAFAYQRMDSFLMFVPTAHRMFFELEYTANDILAKRRGLHYSHNAADIQDELHRTTRALLGVASDICVSRQYYCSFDAPTSNMRVTGLNFFERQLFADISRSVRQQYAAFGEFAADPLMLEHVAHGMQTAVLARNVVGRDEQIRDIIEYLESPEVDNSVVPLVVWGQYGVGTSTLMAQVVEQFNEAHEDDETFFVVSHFVGASANSYSLGHFLTRTCALIKRQFGGETHIPMNIKQLRDAFPSFLEAAGRDARVVVIIDSVHLLRELDHELGMLWVPILPPNVRMVVSCADGPCYDGLVSVDPQPLEIEVTHLSMDARLEIVRSTMAMHRRPLCEDENDPVRGDEMSVLLTKADSWSPLYLCLACNVHVLGTPLPDIRHSISDLVTVALEQLEDLHGYMRVSSLFALLDASRGGLLEGELADMVFLWVDNNPNTDWGSSTHRSSKSRKSSCNHDGTANVNNAEHEKEEVNSNVSRLLSAFSLFLPPTAGGLLRIVTPAIVGVVAERYSHLLTAAHTSLAWLFRGYATMHAKGDDGNWSMLFVRGVNELPYHLALSAQWKELAEVLSDLGFLENKCWIGRADLLIDDYLVATACLNAALEVALAEDSPELAEETAEIVNTIYDCTKVIEAYRRFYFTHGHVMCVYPHATFTQAASTPSSDIVGASAAKRREEGFELRAWIEHVNKSQNVNPCQMVITGHDKHINCCAFSPNGQYVVSGSEDSTICVWSTVTGSPVFKLAAHRARVECIAVSSDGCYIASGSGDKTIKVFSSLDGHLVHELGGNPRSIFCLAFSPVGDRLLSGSRDNALRVWDINSGECLEMFGQEHTDAINGCSYSSDGEFFVTASRDKSLKIWTATPSVKARTTLLGHSDAVVSCDISDDCQRIVSASLDGTSRLWSVLSGQEQLMLQHEGAVFAARFSVDGERIVTASKDEPVLWVWDALSGNRLGSLDGHMHWVTCCAVCSSDGRIVSGSRDSSLRIWDGATLSVPASSFGHAGAVFSVKISPDGQHIITCSKGDNFIQLWTRFGELSATLEGHEEAVLACEFSPDSHNIASGGFDRTLKFWSRESGELRSSVVAHDAALICCAYSFDGLKVVTGSRDRRIKVWTSDTQQLLNTLEGLEDTVLCVGWLNDGRVLSGSGDKKLVAWSLSNNAVTKKFDGHEDAVLCLAYSHAHDRLVSASRDGVLKVWNFSEASVETSFAHPPLPHSLALDHVGSRSVTISPDRTVKVFSSEYEELAVFAGAQPFMCVDAFADSDGSLLIAAGCQGGHLYVLRYIPADL